jgi:hypothetical protein
MNAERRTTISAGLQFFKPIRLNEGRIPPDQLQAEAVRLSV